MAKAAYPTIGIAALVMFGIVYFIGCLHKVYQVDYYNLDVIISVGYRVKSKQGTRFRQWANQVLKDYLLKGYSINHRLQALERTVAEHSKYFNKTSIIWNSYK